MQLSRRVNQLKPSATLAVNQAAADLKRQGIDVLSFAAGEPDFGTPERITAAAIAALKAGKTKYGPVPGDPDAREAIAKKLTKENNIPNLTPDNVVVSSGGKHTLALLFETFLDPPEPGKPPLEVVLPTPAWVSYEPQVQLAGGTIVEIPTTAAADFKATPEQFERAITPNTRAVIINSPSNPCGTMYTPDELEAIATAIARATDDRAPDLVVISDELYEKILLDDIPHRSPGSIPAIAERTITVNGLSKAYAMTGWRIGYFAMPGEPGLKLAKAVAKLQSQSTTCIPTFLMPAVRVALTDCADEVEQFRQTFERRATLIVEAMQAIPGLKLARPTGAFYAFPDVSAHFGKQSPKGARIDSALSFAAALLDEHHVACVPGEDFGTNGEKCCRFSFACSDEQIIAGMQRLGAFVASLK